MNNRNKERMTTVSGCEISDNDIGLRMSIRNCYSHPPPPNRCIIITALITTLTACMFPYKFRPKVPNKIYQKIKKPVSLFFSLIFLKHG